jgi:hypothetical protein
MPVKHINRPHAVVVVPIFVLLFCKFSVSLHPAKKEEKIDVSTFINKKKCR